jgi:hypothetical protein
MRIKYRSLQAYGTLLGLSATFIEWMQPPALCVMEWCDRPSALLFTHLSLAPGFDQ